ncbi:MAG TPA: 4-hydroxy-2-oxovalerate aldolase [Bacillota bacterium]|jgi:4-hydroxy 2-oxovalerate aldolase|nr:4-hydroxy-2-oxovalerate aldolase [Bacillota bacterium]
MTIRKRIHIVDTTLRDGMHAVSHQFTPNQARSIAAALDAAKVEMIEVSHGDGLGGSSVQYGFAAASDEEYLEAVAGAIVNSQLAVLLLPGIGTQEDLKMARDHGAAAVRVATHATEADIGEQHIKLARDLGMRSIGFLMMSHMVSPEKLLEQAKLMESYGAEVVYVADSAGAMLPEDVRARVGLVKENLGVDVGFHAHNNLMLAIGNTLAAIESGATYVDATLRGLGGGAGNSPTEVLAGVLDRAGYDTGMDFYKAMDAAEQVVEPLMHRPQQVSNASLMLGYAGVYSSFLLHTHRAAERFGVDSRDILVELGRHRIVGGQEDTIIDVAYGLSKASR